MTQVTEMQNGDVSKGLHQLLLRHRLGLSDEALFDCAFLDFEVICKGLASIGRSPLSQTIVGQDHQMVGIALNRREKVSA